MSKDNFQIVHNAKSMHMMYNGSVLYLTYDKMTDRATASFGLNSFETLELSENKSNFYFGLRHLGVEVTSSKAIQIITILMS